MSDRRRFADTLVSDERRRKTETENASLKLPHLAHSLLGLEMAEESLLCSSGSVACYPARMEMDSSIRPPADFGFVAQLHFRP